MELNAFNLGMPYKWLPPKLLLIMKLIIIIMISFLMQVHASTFGQLVTLKEKNLSLEDAFKMIRNQTGYDFIFDATLLKDTQPIAIDVKDFSLEESLTVCLSGQNLTFEIKNKSVTIKRKSILNNLVDYLNAIDIRGKVFDEKGNPLIGAVIRIKGGARQTATNSRESLFFRMLMKNRP